MAGIDAGAANSGGRKTLDSEINMIPMIDLLMVTISFLLITAVWSHMARMEADADVPSNDARTPRPGAVPRILDVRVEPERFVLTWREGSIVVSPPGAVDVPRVRGTRYRALTDEIDRERPDYARPAPAARARAVVHEDNQTEYADLVAVLDAIAASRDTRGGAAFDVTLGGD
jgi:biopolymer transport protein ExbD